MPIDGNSYFATFDRHSTEDAARFRAEGAANSNRAFPEQPIKAGGIYPAQRNVVHNTDQLHHRPNEWFTIEVLVQKGTTTVKVNGKINSEASTTPYSTIDRSHIALQIHHLGTNKVEFRNLEIMPLPD